MYFANCHPRQKLIAPNMLSIGSGSPTSLGECFVRSIICSQGVTLDGSRDGLQDVDCGKVERKCSGKVDTNR